MENIISAENTLRNDCSVDKSTLVTLEMLLDNSFSCEKTSWRGPYIEKSSVQKIIDSGKDWCTPPKLNNDCTDSKFFERMLKNCVK